MTEIKIGGRTIPLLYTTYELVEIQKELGCTGFQLKDQVFGLRQTDEDDPESIVFDCVNEPEKTEKLCRLIRILGNAGLEEKGEEPDLTDKWVMRKIKPSMILPYALITVAEVIEGNRMESQEKQNDGKPVDEGLEEQQAKKQQGN